jgi:hypothetical protein
MWSGIEFESLCCRYEYFKIQIRLISKVVQTSVGDHEDRASTSLDFKFEAFVVTLLG